MLTGHLVLRTLVLACSLVLLSGAAAPEASALPDGPFALTGTLDERFLSIFDAEVPLERWVAVQDVLIPVGALRIVLRQGAVSPIQSSAGVTTGAVFRGECALSYRAPEGIEARTFARLTGREAWEDEGCDFVLLHTDDAPLLERLALDGPPIEAPPKLSEEHRILLKDFVRDSALPLAALARHLGASRGGTASYDVLAYGGEYGAPEVVEKDEPKHPYNLVGATHNPLGLFDESEGFLLFAARRFGTGKHSQLLNSHPVDGAPNQAAVSPAVQVLRTELRLDLDIVPTDSFLRMQGEAKVTLSPTQRPTQAMWLSLSGGVPTAPLEPGAPRPPQVTEVQDYKGRPLPFLHRQGRLLVWLASPVQPGQAEVLTIRYAGSSVRKEGTDHFGMFANWNWFPAGQGRPRMGWKATVCLPDGPLLAGTGVTLSAEVKDGRRCEVMEAAEPVNFPALNLGWWQTASSEANGRTIRAFFDRDYAHQLQPALTLTADVMEYYEGVFGPAPHKEIDVAQGREERGFWQAPDGLVEMSPSWNRKGLSAFKVLPRDYIEDFSSYILAHELAHQFWGHIVTSGNYRDQWISESFADYSAYLYMVDRNGAAGHRQWWRRSSVFAGRRGVIALGSRNRGLYQPLVYSRGPLVIHMFREMVGDEAFFVWLRTLMDVGRERAVSTEDLILIAEHVTGPDARWFWEQWLQAPGVPDLSATWALAGPSVRLALTQENTPSAMKLRVPVLLRSKKGPEHDVLHYVATAEPSFEVLLPLPRGGLKDVQIDPYDQMVRDEAKATRESVRR